MVDEKVCMAGMGYVGLTMSVVLAECGYEVTGVDISQSLVDQLNQGNPHFFEEALDVRLKNQTRRGRLKVQTTMPSEEVDVHIISVGTPLISGTQLPDLSYLDNVVEDVARNLKKGGLVLSLIHI